MMGETVGGLSRITFYTDDIDETYEELAAKGVQFPQKLEKQPWVDMLDIFADPDGNFFVLIETAPR